MRRTPTTSFTGIVYLPRIRPIILPAERYCSDEWAEWSKERWRRGRHLPRSSKRPRRHPSGGLRRLLPRERTKGGPRSYLVRRVQLLTPADIPAGWVWTFGACHLSADPSNGPDRMVSALWEQTPDGPHLLASSAR